MLIQFAHKRKSIRKRLHNLSIINKRRRFISWKSFTNTSSLQHYIFKSAANYNQSHLLEHAFTALQSLQRGKRQRHKKQIFNRNADLKLKQRFLSLWHTRLASRITLVKKLPECRVYNQHRVIQQWQKWISRTPKSLKLKIELFHKRKIFLVFYDLLHAKHLRHRNFENALKLSKTRLFRQWTQQLLKLKANHDFHNRWKSRCYYKLLIRALRKLHAKVVFRRQMDHIVMSHQAVTVFKQWFHHTQNLQLQHYSLQRGELRFQVSKLTLALQRWNYHLGKDLLLSRKFAVFRKLHPYPRCSFVATVFYHWRYEIVELARLWQKFAFLKTKQRNKIMIKHSFVNWQDVFNLHRVNCVNKQRGFKRWLKKFRLRMLTAETLAYQVQRTYHHNKGRKSDGTLSLPQFLLRLFYYRSLPSVVTALKSGLLSRKAIFIQRCFFRRIFQFWYLRVLARSRELAIMQEVKSKAGKMSAFHAHCLQTIASKRFQSTALKTFKTWKNEFFRQSKAVDKIMLNTQGRLFLRRWMRLYNFHAMQHNLNIGNSNSSNSGRRTIYKLVGDMSYVDLKGSRSETQHNNHHTASKAHHTGKTYNDRRQQQEEEDDSLVMSDISVSHAGSMPHQHIHHHKSVISKAAIRSRGNHNKVSSSLSVGATEQENSRSINNSNSAMMKDVVSFNLKQRSYLTKF